MLINLKMLNRALKQEFPEPTNEKMVLSVSVNSYLHYVNRDICEVGPNHHSATVLNFRSEQYKDSGKTWYEWEWKIESIKTPINLKMLKRALERSKFPEPKNESQPCRIAVEDYQSYLSMRRPFIDEVSPKEIYLTCLYFRSVRYHTTYKVWYEWELEI